MHEVDIDRASALYPPRKLFWIFHGRELCDFSFLQALVSGGELPCYLIPRHFPTILFPCPASSRTSLGFTLVLCLKRNKICTCTCMERKYVLRLASLDRLFPIYDLAKDGLLVRWAFFSSR